MTFPQLQIAKHALGKYIIGAASALHLYWAALLFLDIRAGNSTPVSIFFSLLHYRSSVIGLLVLVSMLAVGFLDLRLRKRMPTRWLTLLLIPQQLTLLLSAGISIHCMFAQRYADGVEKSWAHIGADQASIVIMTILYTVSVFESFDPPSLLRYES